MRLVIKILNQIRSQSLQRRLLKTLTDEMGCQYGDLRLHIEMRRLN